MCDDLRVSWQHDVAVALGVPAQVGRVCREDLHTCAREVRVGVRDDAVAGIRHSPAFSGCKLKCPAAKSREERRCSGEVCGQDEPVGYIVAGACPGERRGDPAPRAELLDDQVFRGVVAATI